MYGSYIMFGGSEKKNIDKRSSVSVFGELDSKAY